MTTTLHVKGQMNWTTVMSLLCETIMKLIQYIGVKKRSDILCQDDILVQ